MANVPSQRRPPKRASRRAHGPGMDKAVAAFKRDALEAIASGRRFTQRDFRRLLDVAPLAVVKRAMLKRLDRLDARLARLCEAQP